jgi:hypothetical protein
MGRIPDIFFPTDRLILWSPHRTQGRFTSENQKLRAEVDNS